MALDISFKLDLSRPFQGEVRWGYLAGSTYIITRSKLWGWKNCISSPPSGFLT